MKAVFEFPHEFTWVPPRTVPYGWTLTKKLSYERTLKNGTTLDIDNATRHITIQTPDGLTPIPWVACYLHVRQLFGKGISATRVAVAKAWFRKLKVVEHEGSKTDLHPTNAGPRDDYKVIHIGAGIVRYDAQYSFTTKREFLGIMGSLYDTIQNQLKRSSQ